MARRLFLIRTGKIRTSRQADGDRELSLGLCGPGELIGDYGLLAPGLMTVTCRAAEPTAVVTFSLHRFRDELSLRPELRCCSLRDWIRFHFALRYLRQHAYLGFMSPPSFLPMTDSLRAVEFAPNLTIQGPGLADDCCFVIREGVVEVGETGQRREAGECFGADTFLGKAPRQVRTVSAVQGWVLRRDQFLEHDNSLNGNYQSLHLGLHVASTAYPCVRQRQAADCGIAALTTALLFHVSEVAESRVRSLVPLGNAGTNLSDLAKAAEALGFRTHAVRIGVDQLPMVRCPAIAHLADGHYVVLCDTTYRVTIADPAQGVRQISPAEFAADWSGTLLLILPPDNGKGQPAASILESINDFNSS